MLNKKVYLAKHPLASGLDVEYVKSNLLRIPGIQLVEVGDGIKVKNCVALVVVTNSLSAETEEDEIYINQDLYKLIDKFSNEVNVDCVFFYSGKEDSTHPNDVEKTYSLAKGINYYEVDDTDNYENYGIVNLGYDLELLPEISAIIGESGSSYLKVPRHYTPPPQFAMPPIESYTKQSRTEALVTDKLSRVQGRRPLLRAFRGR